VTLGGSRRQTGLPRADDEDVVAFHYLRSSRLADFEAEHHANLVVRAAKTFVAYGGAPGGASPEWWLQVPTARVGATRVRACPEGSLAVLYER
jgi:hypothetical protein